MTELSWLEGRKEGNVLFNDALNTIVYGYRTIQIAKPAAATWATIFDLQPVLFYMHHPTDRITHTTAFVTPVVEHWLEREIAQWVHTT